MTKTRLALVAAVLLIVRRLDKARLRQRAAWQGLSESEVRSKLDGKLSARLPDDKRAQILDKVVAKMRGRGVFDDDPERSGATKG